MTPLEIILPVLVMIVLLANRCRHSPVCTASALECGSVLSRGRSAGGLWENQKQDEPAHVSAAHGAGSAMPSFIALTI
jgi:hypothetical protein